MTNKQALIEETLKAIKRMRSEKTVEEFITVMENAQSLIALNMHGVR